METGSLCEQSQFSQQSEKLFQDELNQLHTQNAERNKEERPFHRDFNFWIAIYILLTGGILGIVIATSSGVGTIDHFQDVLPENKPGLSSIDDYSGIASPSVSPETPPTDQSNEPTNLLPETPVYHRPSPEECEAVSNGEIMMAHEDKQLLHSFKVSMELVLIENVDSETVVEELEDKMEAILMPIIVGCSTATIRRNMLSFEVKVKHRRQLTLSQYSIAGAQVTVEIPHTVCTISGYSNCIAAIANIDLYLKGPENPDDLRDMISSVFAPEEGIIEILEMSHSLVGLMLQSVQPESESEPEMQPSTNPTVSVTTKVASTNHTTAVPLIGPTTYEPTKLPSSAPSMDPTKVPSSTPSAIPTVADSSSPTSAPSPRPTTEKPTRAPTPAPTKAPSKAPSTAPSRVPTRTPTRVPTLKPSFSPSTVPTIMESSMPTAIRTQHPSPGPSVPTTPGPTTSPSPPPTQNPSRLPTPTPSFLPTLAPSVAPTPTPSTHPTLAPTRHPTPMPTASPSINPTRAPSSHPSPLPTTSPSMTPTESPSVSSSPTLSPPIRVACGGDSNTRGRSGGVSKLHTYPYQLGGKLGGRFHVLNFGRNAATGLRGMSLSYVDKIEFQNSLNMNPDIYLLMLGTNDARYWGDHGHAFLGDMKWIVNKIRSISAESPPRIIVAIPPWVKTDVFGVRNDVLVNSVQPAIQALATAKNVQLVNMYNVTYNQEDMFIYDGLHLNHKGYGTLAEVWKAAIECNPNGICEVGESSETCPVDCN